MILVWWAEGELYGLYGFEFLFCKDLLELVLFAMSDKGLWVGDEASSELV